MGQLFSYALQASILLLAMYFIYKWLLANENQYRFNRAVLLLMYVVSFAMFPLLSLFARSENVQLNIGEITAFIVPIEMAEPTFSPWRVVLWIYLAGMALVAFGTLMTVARLCLIIAKGKIMHVDDCTLVLLDNANVAPFSWLHFIVMNKADYDRDGKIILSHEQQHVACHHWVDLLLAQVVIIVCWFNPAAWLMRKELQTVHEYEADKCVLREGVNAKDYQLLLIKMAVGARFPSLANSLNHSKIKKRITMMNNQRTDARRRIRVLTFAPALVLAVLATDIPCVASTLSAASATTLVSADNDKSSKNSPDVQTASGQVEKISISADSNGVKITPDNKDYIYKIDGKVVKSIAHLNSSDIASMSINKQGEKPVVEITTKKAAQKAEKKQKSEKANQKVSAEETPIDLSSDIRNVSAMNKSIELSKLSCKFIGVNYHNGTEVSISLSGVEDLKVISAFIYDLKNDYPCTKIDVQKLSDGSLQLKLHIDEKVEQNALNVKLNTNLGLVVVPIVSSLDEIVPTNNNLFETLSKIKCRQVIDMNNVAGTNVTLEIEGVKEFAVYSAFLGIAETDYPCTKMEVKNQDGLMCLQLHVDKTLNTSDKKFHVKLNTNLGKIVVPIQQEK